MQTEKYVPEWIVYHRRNQKGIKNLLKVNRDGNTTYKNWWVAAIAMWRGMLIVISVYNKLEGHQLNTLTLHLDVIEKWKQNKP